MKTIVKMCGRKTRLASLGAMLAVTLTGTARAGGQGFIVPAWGGSVAHGFDDTHAASPGNYHTGVDFYGPNRQSTYILATSVGTVTKIVQNGVNDHGFGNCVILRHNVVISSNGKTYPYFSMYAHMDSIADLHVGQTVPQGQVLGTMGSTGYGKRTYWGSPPHLHFEIKTANVLENPSGSGQWWGYTPHPAENYGYVNPSNVIGHWIAVP